MAKYIRALTVTFDTEISYKEIPLFRGAVLNSMGGKANMLYHNHIGSDTFRYSYPLIQYKRIGGKAAIVCIEEGADVIGQFLSEAANSIQIGEREARCNTERIVPAKILMQTWKSTFSYQIYRWLPLNRANYLKYKEAEGMIERIAILENILKGNILSMLKGFDIYLEDELIVKITNLSEPYLLHNKGIGLMAFNADFSCNLSIPDNIGLGKNASIGYGVTRRKKEVKQKEII
jgi:hypothetical protein